MEPVQEMQARGPVNFIREGVIIGVINGVIALIILFGSYAGTIDTFNTAMFIARFAPYMMLNLVLNRFRLRKKNSGVLTFKDALQYALLSFVLADVMIGIVTYFLYNVIDPDLTRRSIDYAIRGYEQDMAKMDPKHRMEMAREIDNLRKTDPNTPLRVIVSGFGIELLFDFVKSLI